MADEKTPKEQLKIEYILWKPIKNWEEYYEVSNTGLVRSIGRTIINKAGHPHTTKEKLLSFKFDKDGYFEVSLNKNSKGYSKRVHRLVAQAFIPNPENKPIPNHLNGIRNDNRVTNLAWATQSENKIYSFTVLGVQTHNKKKINQYTLDGEFIREWESITFAAKSLNAKRQSIRDAVNNKQKTSRGYIWKKAS